MSSALLRITGYEYAICEQMSQQYATLMSAFRMHKLRWMHFWCLFVQCYEYNQVTNLFSLKNIYWFHVNAKDFKLKFKQSIKFEDSAHERPSKLVVPKERKKERKK